MSYTPPIYNVAIQPPSIATPSGLLFPPPTLLFRSSAPPNSPFSLTASNLLAIASLVPASIDSSVPDDITGTLAVPAIPLSDGSGVAFVFRNLSVERAGQWRIRITVLRMNEERDGDEGAVVAVEVVSAVVRVE